MFFPQFFVVKSEKRKSHDISILIVTRALNACQASFKRSDGFAVYVPKWGHPVQHRTAPHRASGGWGSALARMTLDHKRTMTGGPLSPICRKSPDEQTQGVYNDVFSMVYCVYIWVDNRHTYHCVYPPPPALWGLFRVCLGFV